MLAFQSAALAGVQALAKIDIRGHSCPDGQYVHAAVTTQCRKQEPDTGHPAWLHPQTERKLLEGPQAAQDQRKAPELEPGPLPQARWGRASERSSISPLVSHHPRKGPVWNLEDKKEE